jgi:PPM family protein phosphatase
MIAQLDAPPPSGDVTVEFGARSERGPLRPVNEDHFLILRWGRREEALRTSLPPEAVPIRFEEFGYGMFVADGMGQSGEAASRLAISTLVHLGIYFGKWHVRLDEPIAEEIMDRARRFYRNVNAVLLEANQDSGALQTTMTAVYTAGTGLFFAHVGHSRAYLFRDDRLLQLTHDHTLERRRPGQPTILDLARSARDRRHILTQTLGGPSPGSLAIDVERFGLLDDDRIVLCTNGLTDVIDDQQIAAALRSRGTPDEQCQALVDRAAAAGGADDVTVLVARYHVAIHGDDFEEPSV